VTVPVEGPRRDRKREADRRSYRRRKARAAGKTPEPAVRPVVAPRIRSSREQLPQTPGAPCQADPSLWFPEAPTLAGRRAEAEQAKAICSDCPFRAACLAGALARREMYGIWGGVDLGSAAERRLARKAREAAA